MNETQNHRWLRFRTARQRNPLGFAFVAGVLLLGSTYTAFELTPSSYAILGNQLQQPGLKPFLGTPKAIRSDEWGLWTPYFQAAVRNGFQRFNLTSFYSEDLRNINALPIKDWGLIFKPQLWPFFVLSPAGAYSAYWSVLVSAFLIGYYLLFRRFGCDTDCAVAVVIMLYFCGLTQFSWTTFAPVISFFPWVALAVLRPARPLWKAFLTCYALSVWLIALVYPPHTVVLGLLVGLWMLVYRRDVLRARWELAAVAAGTLAAGVVFMLYFSDLIRVFAATVYPGHRRSPPGTVPIMLWLTQILPFLGFTVRDYRNLFPPNICEIGTMGTYVPLLTLCALDFGRVRSIMTDRRLRHYRDGLMLVGGGLILTFVWMVSPATPEGLGRLLLWDRAVAGRLLPLSGLLLTTASLLVWAARGVVITAWRGLLFLFLGPVASFALKRWYLNTPAVDCTPDLAITGALAVGLLTSAALDRALRQQVALLALVAVNVYGFARFNPVQPAGPIFNIEDNALLRSLRQQAAGTPGGYLISQAFFGSTLNGLGFRSVSHTLIAPQLSVWKRYFPYMKAEEFNQVFNRYGHVQLTGDPVPFNPQPDVIRVPISVFEPVRNTRQAVWETQGPAVCASARPGGALDRTLADTNNLVLVGWAPWVGENGAQKLHVASRRRLIIRSVVTELRPDVAEVFRNYNLVGSGFRLAISSADGLPLKLQELTLIADETIQGKAALHGCRAP